MRFILFFSVLMSINALSPENDIRKMIDFNSQILMKAISEVFDRILAYLDVYT